MTAEATRHAVAPHAVSAAARTLAERVASRVTGGEVRVACLLPSGRPIALPRQTGFGCPVSLSHTHTLLAAAASRDVADVGIDIVATTDSHRGLDWCCAAVGLRDADAEIGPAGIWAAKEAAYKAARIDTGFQPRRMRIMPLDTAGFRWTCVADFGTIGGVGRWLYAEGHVVAIAVRPTAAQHLDPDDLIVQGRGLTPCS